MTTLAGHNRDTQAKAYGAEDWESYFRSSRDLVETDPGYGCSYEHTLHRVLHATVLGSRALRLWLADVLTST